MSDYRELFVQDIKNDLLCANIELSQIDKITEIIISKLKDYDLQRKSTAIAIRETESEQILKVYGNTLLTEGKSTKTVMSYIQLLTRFMYEVNKPLLEVGVFDVRIWLANQQLKLSKRTCENYRSYLSAFYQWLLKEDLIKKNPMIKVNPIKYEEEVRKAFSDAEIDALRSACRTERERAEFEVLLSSGARVSELCAMNINDVDLTAMTIIIREGKGGKQRIVYINDVCRRHLKKYLESRTDDKPYLFITRNGGRLKKGSAEADLHRIGEIANVNNVHPHRCRRTFATSMNRRGMDVHTIQRLMGHSNINTTMQYIALNDDYIQNEYRKYN